MKREFVLGDKVRYNKEPVKRIIGVIISVEHFPDSSKSRYIVDFTITSPDYDDRFRTSGYDLDKANPNSKITI